MNRVSPEEKYYALTLYRHGVSINSISKELKRTWTTVERMIDPEKVKAANRKYYAANKSKINKWHKEWRTKNPEKMKESFERYHYSDKGKQRYDKYRKSDKGQAMERRKSAMRRQLKKGCLEQVFIDNQWYEVDREATWEVFKDVLMPEDEYKAIEALYNQAQELSTDEVKYHVDHIQPLSKGGEHLAINLQIITADENLSKHNEFRQEDQELLCRRYFTV